MQSKVHLSKSKFCAGLQCLKRLYWLVHEPETRQKPDEVQQAILDQGTDVGKVAQQIFAGGVLVEAEYYEVEKALERTKELMADPKVPAIFEGAFLWNDILIRTDILKRVRGNRWKLYEVKSSTRVREDCYHVADVAIQKYVLEHAGVNLVGSYLMHLNRDYVFDGEHLIPGELFTVADFPDQLATTEKQLPDLIQRQWDALAQENPPDVAPGDQCACPYACEFFDRCNEPVPANHVSTLPGIRKEKLERLLEMGIDSIRNVPDDFPLSAVQRRVCECVKSGRPYFASSLMDELDRLNYPLSFMDFETFYPAIPRYAQMRPYDHIPFQWSVHVQPEKGAKVVHHEFLADDDQDPRVAFIESLLEVLEASDGHIVVYNQSFESARLSELARWFPEYFKRIVRIKDRLWDLLPVVRKHVYHPDFGGSFSIKSVLPALVPSMSYREMEVAAGAEAGLVYSALIGSDLPSDQRSRLRASLLAYCRQDTHAMVLVLKELMKQ